MAIPGLNPKTQNDLVEQQLSNIPKEVTEVLKFPGVETLHTKSKEDIAAVLANLLKSRNNVTKLTFVVGSHLEITFESNPFNQIR